jgi:uncharacterized Zn finger protein (UPF0148 family)
MLFCPRCGDDLAISQDGELACARGGMSLMPALEHRLRECYELRSRQPRDIVFTYNGSPHGIGGTWFCPGCGVAALEATPGDLRCPDCLQSLVEFITELIELHPHSKCWPLRP